jgi:hypothetical protein
MSGDAKMGAIVMWQTATKLLGQRYVVVVDFWRDVFDRLARNISSEYLKTVRFAVFQSLVENVVASRPFCRRRRLPARHHRRLKPWSPLAPSLYQRFLAHTATFNLISIDNHPSIHYTVAMAQFRPKKLDLGCFVHIMNMRDHTKRKVFEQAEPER